MSLQTMPFLLPALPVSALNTLQRSAFTPCALLSLQFKPVNNLEKPDHNHLSVGNQDGPGLEKRVGSAASVLSNAVEGKPCPSLGALVGLGCSAHTSDRGWHKSLAPCKGWLWTWGLHMRSLQ